MQGFVARIASVLLHPLLMSTYVFLIIFNTQLYFSFMPGQVRFFILGLVFLTTFLIPLTFILFLYNLKVIDSLSLADREDRLYPFVISSVCYLFGFYILNKLPVMLPAIVTATLLGGAISIVFCTVVNGWWKISAHMAGIGGVFSAFLSVAFVFNEPVFNIIVGVVLAAGVLGFARIYLKAHTPAQVVAGFAGGATIMALVMLVAATF